MRATCATIHPAALAANLARVQALAGPARVMAVIKADGYGHGLERAARAFAGADAFGVAGIADALRLRAAGIGQRIVVLSGHDEAGDLAEMRRLGVDTVVHCPEQLALLAADRDPRPLRVWLKIDSGMHRLGFAPAAARDAFTRLGALANVAPDIVLMSHFANSDAFDAPDTAAQIASFEAATEGLPGPRSLANSAAVLGWPGARCDWVRVGGALYGMSVVPGRTGADFGLQPAMTLSTCLLAVKTVRRGEPVGYGCAWRAPEDMPLGIAAIGYGDGYPRSAPAQTPVLVNGRRARLAGRVSMDLLTLDLRGHDDARPGDPVTLWGPGLPIEEVATHAGTIAYDLTCGLTRRVRFVED